MIEPLVISAPFGNYIQPSGATPTLGTFTAARRRGRLWRILRTVRYSPSLGAWVNKIGLRNPGIDWLVERSRNAKVNVRTKIVSIHGFTDDDWALLLDRIGTLKPLAVELNMSCPNVGHVNWPTWLFDRAMATGVTTIVKVPPVNERDIISQALASGVRAFHCCNTIPVPAGGVSGKPLKPVSLQVIVRLRETAAKAGIEGLTIIGGGGITTPADIDDYVSVGATHVAIGTKTFNPMTLISSAPLRPLIERAHARLDRYVSQRP